LRTLQSNPTWRMITYILHPPAVDENPWSMQPRSIEFIRNYSVARIYQPTVSPHWKPRVCSHNTSRSRLCHRPEIPATWAQSSSKLRYW
jgi:hypothetical protein